jgi:hypothetical protein
MLLSKLRKVKNGRLMTKDADVEYETRKDGEFFYVFIKGTNTKASLGYFTQGQAQTKMTEMIGTGTTDEKVISISTPQWEGDIRIIDGSHFEMKAKGTDKWTWALHIGQADDHILNALKAKGALKDGGRFFVIDRGIKDDFTWGKSGEFQERIEYRTFDIYIYKKENTFTAYAVSNKNGKFEISNTDINSVRREAKKKIDQLRQNGDSKTKDSFTGIDSIKAELKEAEDDLARAKAKNDPAWIHEASGYVAELKKELANWSKNNDADEKFSVGSKVRVNTQGSETMEVLRRDGTTVWTNKGAYHEDKLVAV